MEKKSLKIFLIISKKKPKKFITAKQISDDENRGIADFISGMTDRYAINLYKGI